MYYLKVKKDYKSWFRTFCNRRLETREVDFIDYSVLNANNVLS